MIYTVFGQTNIIEKQLYTNIHSVMEFLSITVSAMVFALGWNLRDLEQNRRLIILGCMFLSVAFLDILHVLSFQGMPDLITPSSPEKAIAFWLVARCITALALLSTALLPNGRWNPRQCYFALLGALAAALLPSWIVLYHPDWLPQTFLPGSGLTRFKINTEYVLTLLYAAATGLLFWRAQQEGKANLLGLAVASWILGLGELLQTAYGPAVSDALNLGGHILKVLAYVIVYQTLFAVGVRTPYLAQTRDRALLRALIDSIPDLIFFKDTQSVYMGFNKAFAAYCGKAESEMVGKTDSAFAPPEIAEYYRQKDQEMLADNTPRHNEEWIDYPDGRRVLLDTLKGPFFGPDGELLGLIGISRDITKKKAAEEQLRQVNQELETLTYVASHDLQEPVRMIASYLQLLQRDYGGKLGEDADLYIKFAVDGVHRMHRQIKDILMFSRLNSEGGEPVPVDMNQAVEAARESLQGSIADSQARITHMHLPTIKAAPQQMIILFTHLLDNAVKYRRRDVAPEIHINAVQQGNQTWLFSVRDNGIGIAPEYWERIFAVFQRLHSRDQYEGSGIGLAICRRIVERHGGDIWVESSPSHGSTFFFTLPAA